MSAAPAPRWQPSDDWAGFALVIVPVDEFGRDVEELMGRTSGYVAADPTLGETVGLGLAPTIDERAKDPPAAIARTLVRAATRNGYVLAPRVAFGILVIGPAKQRADQIAARLAEEPRLQRLRAHTFSRSSAGGGFAVPDVLDVIDLLRDQYEQWPNASLTEAGFLELVSGRRPTPARAPTPAPAAQASTARDLSPEIYRPDHRPAPPEPVPDEDDPLRTAWKSAVGKVRGLLPQPPPTQRETMDRLAGRRDGLELVYVVLAPDLTPPSRAVGKRRRDLVLEIDAAFARYRGPAGSPFQVSVLAGDRKLTRPQAILPAGQLGAKAVPKAGVGHFDLSTLVDDLLDLRLRDIASLRRRGTAVSGTYVLLLSSHAPLADIDAVEHIQDLAAEARIVWILVGAEADLLSEDFAEAGANVFEDHPDVVNEVMTSAFAEPGEEGDGERLPGVAV